MYSQHEILRECESYRSCNTSASTCFVGATAQHHPENSVLRGHYTHTINHLIFPDDQSKLCMPGAPGCQEIPDPGMPSPLTLLKETWTCGNLFGGQACAPMRRSHSAITLSHSSSEQRLCLHCTVSWIRLFPPPQTLKEGHCGPQI